MSRCIDGVITKGYPPNFCASSPHGTYKDPVLVIDYGKVTEITSIRVYNRNDCCAERIDGATVSITADEDGRAVVWSSKFEGTRSTYTFQTAATGV